MPPLAFEASYLIEILFEIGPTQPFGMGGQIGISELEMQAWQANRSLKLTAWEASTLRHLSREYAAMLGEAQNPNCPAPWTDVDIDRDKVAQGFAAWAEQMKKL